MLFMIDYSIDIYSVFDQVQEIQSRRAIEGPENVREKEEVKKLRTLVTDSRKDISAMRQRVKILNRKIKIKQYQ